MYDIFDDIFDDGYGSNDYGMSDTDVEVELAFEAAMGTGTDYEYDYATEGFRDAMGKMGTKIAATARNMVRKIGEMFRKIVKWVTDKLAPLRVKSKSSDNKALQQVLKALDRQVENASGPRKAEVKQRVARVKRAIMQYIDFFRDSVSKINKVLNDGVSVFKAAQSIGKSFIEKMNAAVMAGSEKGNTDDGNDLIDKMNSLEKRYASMVSSLNEILEDDGDDSINEIIDKEMPGSTSRMVEVLKAIKWDKVDFRAIFAAEAELRVTCNQGQDASDRLIRKLNDLYSGFKKNGNVYDRHDDLQITDPNKKFDDDSRQNLSALTLNWQKFASLQGDMSKMLTDVAAKFEKGSGTVGSEIGIRKTGRYTPNAELPKTFREMPTDQTIS